MTWYDDVEIRESMKAFLSFLFEPIVCKLGYEYAEGEDDDTSLLRTMAIGSAAGAGAESVMEKLKELFKECMTSGDVSHIPPDLVAITFQIGVREGGIEEWKWLRTAYLTHKSPAVQQAAISGLCNCGSGDQAKEQLDETYKFMKDGVRPQDLVFFMAYLGRNSHAEKKALQFLKDNFDELNTKFGGTSILPHIVALPVSILNSEQDAADIEAFFEDKDTSKFSMRLAQALESIRARAAWKERSTEEVREWIKERNISSGRV